MVAIAPNQVAAVLILGAVDRASALRAGSAAQRLLADAAAGSAPTVLVAGGPYQRAGARIAESFFGANALDPTAMKIDLMQRLGGEFGISMDDFETQFSFGRAVRQAIGELMSKPGGQSRLHEIEKTLGLDELGVSVHTLASAILEPGGDDGAKLDAALREKAGELAGDARPRAAAAIFHTDETGLYGFR